MIIIHLNFRKLRPLLKLQFIIEFEDSITGEMKSVLTETKVPQYVPYKK